MPDYAREQAAGGRVAGVDEAGRGPLAGPVVAAAVVFRGGVAPGLAVLLDDSKVLDAGRRLIAYRALRGCAEAEIAVGAASVREIDGINILQASLLAMRRAIGRLAVPPDLALVDGNQAPRAGCKVTCVVDGDALCLSIAAASIVAKVTRDRAMQRLHLRFPHYGWHRNAGYATADHRAALHLHGPSAHHRAQFGTVRAIRAARLVAQGLADQALADQGLADRGLVGPGCPAPAMIGD